MSTPTSYHLPHSVHLMLDNPPLHRSQPRNTSIAASPPQKPSGSHTVSTTQIQQLTCPIRPQPTDSYRRSACEPAASSGQDLSFSNVTQFSVFRVLQGSFRSIHESRREGTRSLGKEKSISDYYGCRKNNAISAFLHEPAAGLGVGSCARDPCCPSLSRSSVGVNGQCDERGLETCLSRPKHDFHWGGEGDRRARSSPALRGAREWLRKQNELTTCRFQPDLTFIGAVRGSQSSVEPCEIRR